nr:DNA repair protein complementing XP-C cells homolog [Danaus plexippus plexippus]
MPTTRKKVIKTVYKDEEDSNEGGDFSDSGSDAVITEQSSSEEDGDEKSHHSSDDDFISKKPKSKGRNQDSKVRKKKTKFTKTFLERISKQESDEQVEAPPISVKDLTEADKLLPSFLNLSESESHSVIPQQGLQLVVDIPGMVKKKTKKLDVEMMLKRKMNRVKKQYQVFMHKVHVLCWLGHGNYVSQVLNDQEVLAEALSLVPSKECYPGERVDMKYVEQITTWYKDKVSIHQDKHENKFRPKAPPLKSILLQQMKKRVFSTKKYMVFVFVSMLRSLGLQCRVMFNFVTLPIRPPVSELCSLSTKVKGTEDAKKNDQKTKSPRKSTKSKSKRDVIPQLDGNYDVIESDDGNIMQVDGGDDTTTARTRRQRLSLRKVKQANDVKKPEEVISPTKITKKNLSLKIENKTVGETKRSVKKSDEANTSKKTDTEENGVSPPKRPKRNPSLHLKVQNARRSKNIKNETTCDENTESQKEIPVNKVITEEPTTRTKRNLRLQSKNTKTTIHETKQSESLSNKKDDIKATKSKRKILSLNLSVTKNDQDNKTKSTSKTIVNKCSANRITRANITSLNESNAILTKTLSKQSSLDKVPKIILTDINDQTVSSKFFEKSPTKRTSRKRSQTTEPKKSPNEMSNARTRSAHATESKYFAPETDKSPAKRCRTTRKIDSDDSKRVSHRDLAKKNVQDLQSPKISKPKNDVTKDLVHIIKGRVKEAKTDAKKRIVKGKEKHESDSDSDHLAVESPAPRKSESDEDFKVEKVTPKQKKPVKKIDRCVISADDEMPLNKINVWCEIYVEELEEWVPVDVVRGIVHSANELYSRSTHPVSYIVGWDNNNYLKDLTRRYVPYWNTVTRKLRVDPGWWEEAIKPWLGPKTARDREEDERLHRMQLEAPLPKVISEYKNHPLYVLKRHLLKFEAIYPPDAETLGFVRGEPVYPRDCVYICKSRDVWIKDAKVVKLGEQPYKIVRARPKYIRATNTFITDRPLEIFGPWQTQDYEPPTAENGIVPRNPYGNVELFKKCMLPKGTVHINLPGLQRVAKKLNIDCAPALTGFDCNGGYVHPVYEGFVVCEEFEKVLTEAWLQDQEELERKEQEKVETRVYGNWKRLIRGLIIKERLKAKYGFAEPSTSQDKKKKGPKLVVKKK